MIVILGGSGFIGTRFCNRLFNKKEENFKIIDIQNSVPFSRYVSLVDVRKTLDLMRALGQNQVTAIVNLAAEHRDDVWPKSLYDEVNVQGARNVCEVAIKKNINKIIFTSSVAVYGFAPLGTDEFGKIAPFNDYGRTKWQAEQIYKDWQEKDPVNRTLVIIRPTVVFGEGNRGNVFNLLKQIASGRFIMVGNGLNRKSMAYVENLAALLEYTLTFKPGIHIYNYIDKPDFSMNDLVGLVNKMLGRSSVIRFRIPFFLGMAFGYCFDTISKISNKKIPISSIRIKKFCSNSVFKSSIAKTGFAPPFSMTDGLINTIKYEFIDSTESDGNHPLLHGLEK